MGIEALVTVALNSAVCSQVQLAYWQAAAADTSFLQWLAAQGVADVTYKWQRDTGPRCIIMPESSYLIMCLKYGH